MNQSSQNALLRLIICYKTQGNTYVDWFIIKIQMYNGMKRQIGRGLEGSGASEQLFLWSRDAPPSQHMDVLTEPEVLQTLTLRDIFFKGRLHHVVMVHY